MVNEGILHQDFCERLIHIEFIVVIKWRIGRGLKKIELVYQFDLWCGKVLKNLIVQGNGFSSQPLDVAVYDREIKRNLFGDVRIGLVVVGLQILI